MPLTMHKNFSKKTVAKNQTSKWDTISNLSYNGQKSLPYGAVTNEL